MSTVIMEDAELPSPKDLRTKYKYNPFCRLWFCWVDPLLWTGFKRPLTHSDIYAHPSEADSRHLLEKFNRYWSKELKGKRPSLLRVLLKFLWWRLIIHNLLLFIEVAILISLAVCVGRLSSYFVRDSTTNSNDNVTRTECGEPGDATSEVSVTTELEAYLYALGICLLSLLAVQTHALGFHLSHFLGMLARVMLSGAIYQKIVRLSHTTVNRVTVGHIVNLSSNDLHRFDHVFLFIPYFWISPFHLAVMTYLVYQEIQYSAFLATGLVILQVPLQIFLMIIFTKLRFKATQLTDRRIKVMNEVITGIRVIKMYSWELPFHDLVTSIRNSEVWLVIKASVIRAINLSYHAISLPLIMFLVFSVYVNVKPANEALTSQKIFTTLTLLSSVNLTSLIFVVQGALFGVEARVGFKRIKDFLLLEEITTHHRAITNGIDIETKVTETVYLDEIKEALPLSSFTSGESSVLRADNLTASWSMDCDNLTLEDVSFTVDKSNPLLAVVGKVGAGKSSLLQCLLRELPCLSGSVTLEGTVGYACQDPWIFSATVRENITFGLPYQLAWYNRVIECCALEKDFDILQNGDLTLVGERGVTLSGGQKSRVNLARAVYRKADVYLLDDPLSAVDTVVSRHIFDRCIRQLLSDKLVVLVTHQLQYVQQCDLVLGLKEGRVTVFGKSDEILAVSSDMDLLEFSDEKDVSNDPRALFAIRKQSLTDQSLTEAIVPSLQTQLPAIEEEEETELEQGVVDPFLSPPSAVDMISFHSFASYHVPTKDDNGTSKKDLSQKQEDTEDKAQGTVSFKTYYKYFKAGGSPIVIAVVILLCLIAEGNSVTADWWISDWATACQNGTCINELTCHLSDNQRIGIYGGLVLGVIVLSILRYSCFFVLLVNASRNVHNQMFSSVIKTPILFFDTNPIGRILNRFSKDIGYLDDLLPYMFCDFFMLMIRTTAILLTAVSAVPITIISAILLFIAFGALRWYYLKSARDIKRLEAISRSPVYSHLSLTLQGLSTIRSYSMQSESMNQFHSYQNKHSQTWYAYIVSTRWFGLRIDLISAIYISVFTVSTVALVDVFDNPALIGLALSYTITLNGMIQYAIRQSAEVENLMVSAERVMAYGKLDSESSLVRTLPSLMPPEHWPTGGRIELEDVSYRHSSDGPLVLKGINCTIEEGEKIGIVGRTGAGKSSLVSLLFRLAEPSGSIKIDGFDVCSMSLQDVRSKISVIPQDPVLFGGTIRYNLDPFKVFEDEDLWVALEQVQLKPVVQSLEGQLDGLIHEGGGNFSVGERQLLCLARALLRDNKILIMDEATANVDLETDGIIQEVIRDEFSGCTVLTVAHRLDTVMDSDKIMVLRAGLLCEFDAPYTLLSDTSSYFHHLVEHTGVTATDKLKEMAKVAFDKKLRSTLV